MTSERFPPRGHPSDDAAGPKWVSLATAPDQLTAEMWQEVLWDEAIPSMLAPHDAVSFLGVAATPVRLMVPLEVEGRAREVLADVVVAWEARDADM